MKPRFVLSFILVLSCLITNSTGAVTLNGSSNGWQQVNEHGFGSVENEAVMTLRALNGYLYAGVINEESGAQI